MPDESNGAGKQPRPLNDAVLSKDAAVHELLLEYASGLDLITEGDAISRSAIENKIFEVIQTKRVRKIQPPDDSDDRADPETSSSKAELTADVFSNGPTQEEADANPLRADALAWCRNWIWNLTQTSERGVIQRRLQDQQVLLVRGAVYRNGETINDGIYVTNRPELIVSEFLSVRLAQFVQLHGQLGEDMTMLRERLPADAADRLQAELDKQVTAVHERLAKLGINLSANDAQQ